MPLQRILQGASVSADCSPPGQGEDFRGQGLALLSGWPGQCRRQVTQVTDASAPCIMRHPLCCCCILPGTQWQGEMFCPAVQAAQAVHHMKALLSSCTLACQSWGLEAGSSSGLCLLLQQLRQLVSHHALHCVHNRLRLRLHLHIHEGPFLLVAQHCHAQGLRYEVH